MNLYQVQTTLFKGMYLPQIKKWSKCKNNISFKPVLRQMEVNKKQGQLCHSWDDLPSEILFMLFDYMPASSLAVCMFVSRTWRDHVEHVLEVKNKWAELFNISEFEVKCKASFDIRQMYYNYVLWHSVEKATVNLHRVLKVHRIKKVNVYRDNLIVVTSDNVQYYQAKSLNKQSTVAWLSFTGEDFLENDHLTVEVAKQDKYLKLQLLMKPHSIYGTQRDVLTIDNVICYKIHYDECHVLRDLNCYYLYTNVNGKWQREFIAKYYGNPADASAINVFHNHCYLMLKSGIMLWMDPSISSFKKMIRYPTWKGPEWNDDITTRPSREMIDYLNARQKFFIWCCIQNFEVCSAKTTDKKTKFIVRRAGWGIPMVEAVIFPCMVWNVSCMLLHSNVLFLGQKDGTVELISLRKLSRYVPKPEPLRRFNVRDFEDIPEPAVLSIDVYEEELSQHMFIATNTHILHLHLTHSHEDYIWSDKAYDSIQIVPE